MIYLVFLRRLSIALSIQLLLSSGLFAEPVFIPASLASSSLTPELSADSWELIEAKTGWLLAAKNPKKEADLASLTKLMTAYIVFELLDKGQCFANDLATISQKAWKALGSRMFVKVDSQVSPVELLKGLIIQSGNDAAVAFAEYIGGTEKGFAIMMNQKAVASGLESTHYVNASGLPAKGYFTSVFDTALLSRAIICDYLGFYHRLLVKKHTHNDIEQPNRNNLLWRDESDGGLKTEYTKAAGYCLAGSAQRDNIHFIAMVMSPESKQERVQAVQSLIEYGFAKCETAAIFGTDEPVQTLLLYQSEFKSADVGVKQTVSVLLPKGCCSELQIEYALPEKLLAPLSTQIYVGEANLSFNGLLLGEAISLRDYPAGFVVDTVARHLVL